MTKNTHTNAQLNDAGFTDEDHDKVRAPLGNYVKFDREMWIRDAKVDGRGHSLSPYDFEENEEKNGDTWFYIYRTN